MEKKVCFGELFFYRLDLDDLKSDIKFLLLDSNIDFNKSFWKCVSRFGEIGRISFNYDKGLYTFKGLSGDMTVKMCLDIAQMLKLLNAQDWNKKMNDELDEKSGEKSGE